MPLKMRILSAYNYTIRSSDVHYKNYPCFKYMSQNFIYILCTLYVLRKHPYLPQGGLLVIPMGRGVQNTKNFKGR